MTSDCRTSFCICLYNIVLSQEVPVTRGEDGCLEVPKIPENQTLYTVWPSDDGTDCICPLCDGGDCVLSNCECYKKNLTFVPQLVKHTPTNNTLCWPNLANQNNNSNVYFFSEAKIKYKRLLSRIYGNDSTYNFVILPGKDKINIMQVYVLASC